MIPQKRIIKNEVGYAPYDEVVSVSYAYEDALLTCFSVAEREQFGELINRLYLRAGSSFK